MRFSVYSNAICGGWQDLQEAPKWWVGDKLLTESSQSLIGTKSPGASQLAAPTNSEQPGELLSVTAAGVGH